MSSAERVKRRRIGPDTGPVLAGILVFIAITLGPSLVGLRTFVGLDLLQAALPYARVAPLDESVTNIFVRDTVDSLLPAYSDFHSRLLDGDFAAWLPWSAGGAPSAALPSYALLSPLSLPYYLLPTWLAPAFVQLLQIALSIGGTFLFLRRLSAGRAAALLGGLVFATSGYMVAWVNWPQTRVGAFIPILFWALERFAQLRTIRSAVPIALAVAGLLLGGFPAVAGLTLYAGGAYLLVRLLADRSQRGLGRSVRDAVVAGAAVTLGVGLTAFQLLPFVSYLGTLDLSYRGEQFFNTTPLKYATTAVFPQAFFANVFGPSSPFSREVNPIEISMHIGSVALILIAVAMLRGGAVRRPRGALSFLVVASAVFLWLIFVQGPPARLLASLPVFDGNPIGRIRSVLGFTAAAAAGVGFDVLAKGAKAAGRQARAEWVLLPAGLLGLLVVGVMVDRAQTPLLGTQVRQDVLIACTAAVVAVGLVLASARWAGARRGVTLVIPLLVAIQGVVAVQNFWPTATRDQYYPETAAHRFLQQEVGADRVALSGDLMFPSSTALYGIRTVGGHSFYARTWAELLIQMQPGAFVAPTIATLNPVDPTLALEPGLDRLSARYYVSADVFPIPGTLVPTGPQAGTTDLAVGQTYDVTIPPQGLRGIGVPVVSASDDLGPGSTMQVTIRDADGDLIAEGGRPVTGAPTPAEFFLPLPAEDSTGRPGPWTASITFGGRADVEVQTVADGQPRLFVVRPVDDGLRLVEVADGITVYERSGALPRIRWAVNTQLVSDRESRLLVVAHGTYPGDTVVLSEAGPAADGLPAEVRVLEDSGDTVRVRVEASGAGYLVVGDAIQTDWSATVDGVPADIVDADHALGAVYIEAGAHDVEFRYTPSGRSTGTAISLVSALLLVLAAVPTLWWRRTRRSRPTTAN
ncbi:MAG: hypothetical protein H0U09_03145 [Geodermatophilaceae bacterium]|nr:hypothetical protein [Geodermatophilaceae bacterium]